MPYESFYGSKTLKLFDALDPEKKLGRKHPHMVQYFEYGDRTIITARGDTIHATLTQLNGGAVSANFYDETTHTITPIVVDAHAVLGEMRKLLGRPAAHKPEDCRIR